MPVMAFRGRNEPVDEDPTPWERAGIPLEVWENAVDVATADYDALVRRLADIYAQGNLAGWSDGHDMTRLARRRISAVVRGERDAVDRVLRGRRSWAG